MMKLIIPSLFKNIDSPSFLPSHLFKEIEIKASYLQYFYVKVFLAILKFLIKIRLQAINIASHVHYGRGLPQEVINNIYTREAADYEWKHHRTTNFRDTWWRRLAAFHIVNLAREKSLKKVKILDIGTGIGLSIEEMFRVFNDFDLEVEAVGLDYNEAMLEEAKSVILPRMLKAGLIKEGKRTVKFIRGDARNLSGAKNKEKDFTYFEAEEFDFVTLICGAGGIHLPLEAFTDQLSVLKRGGNLIMIDIHRPLFNLEEAWPWYFRFLKEDLIQYLGWKEITLPFILRDIWGWSDPTALFYLAPLATDEKYHSGFSQIHFDVVTEKWWFGLPVVTTGRLVLEKRIFPNDEFRYRVAALRELSAALI